MTQFTIPGMSDKDGNEVADTAAEATEHATTICI